MELPEELIGIEEELDVDEEGDEPAFGELDEGDRTEEPGEDEERVQFVIFRLGDEAFAVNVDAVLRVIDVGERTRVPRSSDAVEGITDLRGEITPVIDPRRLFDLPASNLPVDEQDLLVFTTGPDRGNAAIRIDDVEGVELVPVSRVVLEGGDVDGDRAEVEDRLGDPSISGLVRDPVEPGVADYTPVIDVDALLETTRDAIERAAEV